MLSEAINVSIAGISGVVIGIFLLFCVIRITSWAIDKIEKKKETK